MLPFYDLSEFKNMVGVLIVETSPWERISCSILMFKDLSISVIDVERNIVRGFIFSSLHSFDL